MSSTNKEAYDKQEKPFSIYHYTSEAGLLGIIESNSIWATDTQFLNDATEVELAYDLIRERIKRRRKYKLTKFQRNALKKLESALVTHKYGKRTFVTCFSEKADDLNQWRSYSSGNNGIMIGFKLLALESQAKANGATIRRCVYKRDDQIQTIDRLIIDYVNSFEGYFPNYEKGEINGDLLETYADRSAELFSTQIAPFFKHDAFEDEKEWRLVALKDQERTAVKFRTTSLAITPFIEFGLQDFESYYLSNRPALLSTVTIRSEKHREVSLEGLARFLDYNNISRTIIEESELPYRITERK